MKTGAWLRGGRGKIAGMVAQKSSDGKGTVLRELVKPSNPQTIDQMATRLAFGTVTQAAALMLPIIGQTFRGQGDEKLNRRRFVALNTPFLKAEALSQRAGNALAGIFRGKSSSALIPNAYRISEGSLAMPVTLTPVAGQGAVGLPDGQSFQFEVGETYEPAAVLAKMYGITKDVQITICGIYIIRGTAGVNYYASAGSDFVRDSVFAARRLVFNSDAETFVFTAQMTQEQLVAALLKGINREKSSDSIYEAISENMSLSDEHELTIISGLDVGMESAIEDGVQVCLGCFISKLTEQGWDYSNSSMVFATPVGSIVDTNDNWYGLTFENALVDYLGSDAASKLYTRKGGLINDI